MLFRSRDVVIHAFEANGAGRELDQVRGSRVEIRGGVGECEGRGRGGLELDRGDGDDVADFTLRREGLAGLGSTE